MTKSLEIFLTMTEDQKNQVMDMIWKGIDSDVAVKQVFEKSGDDD